MIPASKSPVFEALFTRHARSRIAGSFAGLRVGGAAEARAAVESAPLLIVSNHTAWWDALVALVVSREVLRADGYALMDARNLRRLPFFGKVGAFGVDLDDPRDGARALRYATGLLGTPGRLVWVFPQGRERPITERPLVFRAGSAEIAHLARRARVLPVGLRYELGEEERPVAWVSLGAVLEPVEGRARDVTAGRARQEEAVAAELDRIDATIRSGDGSAFPVLVEGKVSRLGELATKALALLTR